jgi:hypothetical protein
MPNGDKYSERAQRGALSGAPAETARSESSHRILIKTGVPYPATSALKKKARFGTTAAQSRAVCEYTFT